MKQFKKIFFLAIYYAIASKLPNYSFPGGKLYNWLRIFCLKRILSIGNKCRIQRNVYIGDGDNISIGKGTRIMENSRLCNVDIGEYCMIARDTVFLGAPHDFDRFDTPMVLQGGKFKERTQVGNDVWIGIRVTIMPSLSISDGGIIGAHCVLTKNTNPYGIYGGVPGRLIRYRKRES